MPELFDLIAGSETGAIIATTLVIPNNDTTSTQKNQFFANRAVDFFEKNVDNIYHDQQVNTFLRLLIIAVVLSLICGGVYYVVHAYFHYEGFEDRVEHL